MKKTRIIIADKNIKYINPLQQKFVEDYFEKIELEIITDAEFFSDLFSVPQQVDILVVSNELYSDELIKQNIKYIFVMSEDINAKKIESSNVHSINKYTSVSEVYQKIVGISANVLPQNRVLQKNTKIVLVYSASGGTGKTSISFGVSSWLAQNYKKVLYINAERMQTFQHHIKNQEEILNQEIYQKLSSRDKKLYQKIIQEIRNEIFDYVPPFKAALMSIGTSFSIYRELIEFLKEKKLYDYIIVDTEPILDNSKAELMHLADKVLVVTEQCGKGAFSTKTFVENINEMDPEKYYFLCNKFSPEKENELLNSGVNKFRINYYIEKVKDFEQLSIEEMGQLDGIKRAGLLVI